MGLESNVIFLGNVAQQDLVDLYYTADTIVFTHAGITLVEAALSSKPIACYDHDWAEEFIGYNERGLLSPFRDIEALSENIIGLLKNERDAASLGNAAREFAARNFNRDAIAGREREVLGRFFDDGISKGRSS
jgi:glycosyltransferase involved in cell wall biosynthesis